MKPSRHLWALIVFLLLYHVRAADAASLSRPILISPPNSTTRGIEEPVTLVWKPVPRADYYAVGYQALDRYNRPFATSPPTRLPDVAGATSVTLPAGLTPGGKYRWTVIAVRQLRHGRRLVSAPSRRIFKIQAGDFQQVVLNPRTVPWNSLRAIPFAWQAVPNPDPSRTMYYRFQVATDSSFSAGSLIKDRQLQSTVTYYGDSITGVYSDYEEFYWRIRPYHSASSFGEWSETGRLIVDRLAINPDKFVVPVYPVNRYSNVGTFSPDGLNREFTFIWKPYEGALNYRLEVYVITDLERPLIQVSTTVPSYPASLPVETKYKWRVLASRGDLETRWSEFKTFSTEN